MTLHEHLPHPTLTGKHVDHALLHLLNVTLFTLV